MKHLRLCAALGLALVLVTNLAAASLPAGPAQVAKLVATDGAPYSGLGEWVAIDGDTAIVGARYADIGGNTDQGAAYIFYRNKGGPNAWGQVARLTASDGAAYDRFGNVAIDGDTAVVGAHSAGGGWRGKAYVFYRDQGGPDAWGQVTILTAFDGAYGDFYGNAVAVDGDTIMVGAHQWWSMPGAVYVYYRDRGGPDAWGQVTKLTASDGAGNEYFGRAVSVQGDTALVGAPYHTVGGKWGQGTVYVLERDRGGPDAWGQVAELVASDGAAGDAFGYDWASLSGDTAVVSTFWNQVGDNQQGAAYVFYRNQGGTDAWGQVAKLTAPSTATYKCFGVVAVSGDTVVVGNYYDGGYCNIESSTVYIYHRNQGGPDAWGRAAELTADDNAAGDGFGVSVAVDGDTALAGAWGADVGGNVDQGAAYVFYGIQANQPPDCSAAAASPALLWPPNNKFVSVSIGGVTDADDDALTLAITAIRQDEPVGTGSSTPDGKGVGTATAELRAEKLGKGDGRVYHIYFTASDGQGGTCTGEVRVSVPHDQAKPAVDGGALYDSTAPTP